MAAQAVDSGPGHPERLREGLWSMLEAGAAMADVTLVAEGGGKVRAHGVVLAAASKYFRVSIPNEA